MKKRVFDEEETAARGKKNDDGDDDSDRYKDGRKDEVCYKDDDGKVTS